MIRYLVAAPVVIFIVVMAVGGLTGRIRARQCCALPDASMDARMRTNTTFGIYGATEGAPREGNLPLLRGSDDSYPIAEAGAGEGA